MSSKNIPDLSDLCQLYVGKMKLPFHIVELKYNQKYKWLKNTHENEQFILDIIKERLYTLNDFKEIDYDAVYMTILNNNMLVLKYIVEELGLNLSELRISRILRYALYSDSLKMFDYVITNANIQRSDLTYKDNKLIRKILYDNNLCISNFSDTIMYLFNKISE